MQWQRIDLVLDTLVLLRKRFGHFLIQVPCPDAILMMCCLRQVGQVEIGC